jgi:hypothetical protein
MMADRLILRGAKGYEEARVARIFNARRPERPAAVLQAESEFDIVEGVGLARDRGWKVAIRSGGHSIPAWSLRDDALLIDLGGFNETSLDTTTGVASVTTSVTGGSVEVDLQQVFMSGSPHTVGEVSAVGRRCGLTNLLSVFYLQLDRLGFLVLEKAFAAHLAADAGTLVPAERRLGVVCGTVDIDLPSAHRTGERFGSSRVRGPHAPV